MAKKLKYFERGDFAGLTAYRYGAKAPITLAGPQPKLPQARREALTETVGAILEQGVSTKFEFEGACWHGVRSAFCEEGHGYRRADAWSGEIVSEALRRLGAARPSWNEGQPEHTQFGFAPELRYWCERCGKPINRDADASDYGRRYCSRECADSAKGIRKREDLRRHSAAERAALVAAAAKTRKDIADERMTRICPKCDSMFRAKVSTQKYCSRACADAALRLPEPPPEPKPKLPERPCKVCGGIFTPSRRDQTFCTKSCKSKASREALAARLPLQVCPQCGETFQPDRRGRVFCSSECSTAAVTLPPKVCPQCGETFQPSRVDQQHCSHACATSAMWAARKAAEPASQFVCEMVAAE
jgi:hypothetical protein